MAHPTGAMDAALVTITNISDFIWGGLWNGEEVLPIPPLALILLGAGLYMMIGLRFYPVRKLGSALAGLFRKQDVGNNEISSFAALSTALSGQVGTGNLAGVATAITLGGPGAIFWMWVTAFFGMALAFAEGSLAIRFREPAPGGGFRGGPMTYIEQGLGPRWVWLAVLFSLGAMASALIGGNSIQANTFGDSFHELSGLDERWGGAIAAIGVFAVIIGGIRSIARVAEMIVPLMAAVYILTALVALILHAPQIPHTFGLIFDSAFSVQSASGGFLGAGVMMAIRAGVARGLFSNEAGQGTTPMAHAIAKTDDPEVQGRFAMAGTFIDTIVICTMTALVVLTVSGDFTASDASGAQIAVQHAWQSDLSGFAMTAGAFAAAFPMELAGAPIGLLIISVVLILFVFTTLVASSYYGERAITFLYGKLSTPTPSGEKKLHLCWRLLWCVVVFVGSFLPLEMVWRLGDIAVAGMTFPNIIAIIALSRIVFVIGKAGQNDDDVEEPAIHAD